MDKSDISDLVKNESFAQETHYKEHGFKDLREKIQGSKLYKGFISVMSGLALAYAVNVADFNNNSYMNTTSAGSTAEASSQGYKEKHLDNEDKLKEKIEDCGVCWVMYTFDGVSPLYEERAQHFWQGLKEEIGEKVDSYIVADTTNWEKDGQDFSQEEIGKDKYPAFILYENGEQYMDERGVRFKKIGASPKNESDGLINYIKNNMPHNKKENYFLEHIEEMEREN